MSRRMRTRKKNNFYLSWFIPLTSFIEGEGILFAIFYNFLFYSFAFRQKSLYYLDFLLKRYYHVLVRQVHDNITLLLDMLFLFLLFCLIIKIKYHCFLSGLG